MSAKPGTWQKGQSGNPKGRAPTERALTTILERAGSATIEVDGERITGKRLLARLVWQGVITGKVPLPAGVAPSNLVGLDAKPVAAPPSNLELDGKQWVELVKFIYSHIDGPPKAAIDLTTGGEPLRITEVIVERIARQDGGTVDG